MCLHIIYLIYKFREDLVLSNKQWLICHKTKSNQTNLQNYLYFIRILEIFLWCTNNWFLLNWFWWHLFRFCVVYSFTNIEYSLCYVKLHVISAEWNIIFFSLYIYIYIYMISLPDCDTDFLTFLAGVLCGDTLAEFLFRICPYYRLRTSIDQIKEKGFIPKKARN